jgi:hypothetical protein
MPQVENAEVVVKKEDAALAAAAAREEAAADMVAAKEEVVVETEEVSVVEAEDVKAVTLVADLEIFLAEAVTIKVEMLEAADAKAEAAKEDAGRNF